MTIANRRNDWRGLTQNVGNLLFSAFRDWRKSRLTQRLTQLTQMCRKMAEISHWHGFCYARACCGLLTPFGGTTLAVGRMREERDAAATVWDASLGLRTQPSLGCSSTVARICTGQQSLASSRTRSRAARDALRD